MLRKFLATGTTLCCLLNGFAQDSLNTKPVISGSLDVYYRYNFDNPKSGALNNFTSFTNSQNSFELGMATLKAEHSIGKVGGTIDLGFGRRAEEFSYLDGAEEQDKNGFLTMASIKQLFVTYSPVEQLTFTAGKFGTHVGYELLDAHLNRNYSMGYMFSYGPFFHAGLKADLSVSDKTGFMLGITNPTDYATTMTSSKFLIAQFSTATAGDEVSIFLNYQGGEYEEDSPLRQVDLVVTGAISDKFSIGYNGTVQSRKPKGGSSASWWGSALYLNVDPTSSFGFTLRGEYFDDKKDVLGFNSSIFQTTLSLNFKAGPLTIIPELRLDQASDAMMFEKSNGDPSKSTVSAIVAAVYSF